MEIRNIDAELLIIGGGSAEHSTPYMPERLPLLKII